MEPLPAEIPEGATVVPGGWDHEHCFICHAEILPDDEELSFVNSDDRWVCAPCYHGYVAAQRLDFIEWS